MDPQRRPLLPYAYASPATGGQGELPGFERPQPPRLSASTRYRLRGAARICDRRNAGRPKRRPTGTQFLRGATDD